MSAHWKPEVGQAIADRLVQLTGHQLSEARLWRVETTLSSVLQSHKLSDPSQILSALHGEPDGQVASDAITALLNHETSFFRDLNVFRQIETDILPALLDRLKGQQHLRIWSAGCSTGQEAWSLAMMLRRQEQALAGWRVSIHASDLCRRSVARAEAGVYEAMEVQRGLAIRDLMQWFTPVGDQWRVKEELRAGVSFRADNLLNPRFASGRYDLILCRNVLLYLTPEGRPAALASLARHAGPHSVLVLGAGETTIGTGSGFAPLRTVGGAYRLTP